MYNQFNKDVSENEGYLYTTNASVSSELANNRLTIATKSILKNIKGKKILDAGCGDGIYTNIIFEWGSPCEMVGFDLAVKAIDVAQKNYGKNNKNLIFKVANSYKIPYPSKYFDVAIARGLIHHLDDPLKGLEEISRVSKKVLIIDPNGNNPLLKIVERISPYHIKHKETSFTSEKFCKWIDSLHGEKIYESYIGLVPFFCPASIAKLLKMAEPGFEKNVIIRKFLCSVYINYSSY